MLDATTYLGGKDGWHNHRHCNQTQTIGCATITSGAPIFIKGATIRLNGTTIIMKAVQP
jgi:hypothetical protein